ncbi:polyvinylalcohol dehydrogenase [Planctomycetales bacterium]|nr:polyvinylalcohol dehydrogenase [Planctomycetales bacterium]GHT37838.1 polyvinylalcohol dehydrogenase [Planctomycetales bacterium]
MLRFAFTFYAVLCVSISITSASAADWMQWRGPDHNGISQETGLLKSWGSEGPKLVWQVKTLGTGYSNMTFANGMIYSMGDRGSDCFLFAIDEKTGKEVWNVNIGPSGGNYEGPRCTPATDGKLVFALGQFGDFVCVDAKTGKEYWGGNVAKDLGGKVMSGWNFSASPIIDGNNVVLPIGGEKGTVVAFKKAQKWGVNWRSSEITDSCAYTSIVPLTFGGKRQYLLFTDKRVAALNADNGKVLWQADCPGRTAICSDPAFLIDGNICYLVASSAYNTGAKFFKITADSGKFNVEQISEDAKLQSHHGGIVQVGGYFYFLTQRELVCVDPKTGKTLWNEKSVGKGSILSVDGKLILRSETGDGDIALAEPSPDGYKEVSRFAQPERSNKNSWTYPTVHDGRLYIRDQGLLLCYTLK